MSEIYDPRDTLTHDIMEGQVYGDTRSATYNDNGTPEEFGEKLRVVHTDDERVVLRSNQTLDQGQQEGSHHYRCEYRNVFEQNASEGRYHLLTDPEDPPKMPTDGVTTALTMLKRLLSKEEHKVQNGAGRKAKHRVEAFNEAVEAIANIDPTPIDWASVSGVGKKTAEKLNEKGFETDVDVQAASDEQLLDVSGVGQKNLKKIKEEAEA